MPLSILLLKRTPSFSCRTREFFDNFSHFLFYRMSPSDGEQCIQSSAFNLALFYFWPRSSSFCHQPPYPAQPILKTLWCVTSHLTLKAVKSQFSDKSNLNLSGDTIFRSDRDRAACVAIILYKHFEANATFVKECKWRCPTWFAR